MRWVGWPLDTESVRAAPREGGTWLERDRWTLPVFIAALLAAEIAIAVLCTLAGCAGTR